MVLLNSIAYMWYELGEALYIDYNRLQIIRHDKPEDPLRKLSHVIMEWIKKFSDAYWLELVNAVEGPLLKENRKLGDDIRKFLEAQAKHVSCLNEYLLKFMIVLVSFNTAITCTYLIYISAR